VRRRGWVDTVAKTASANMDVEDMAPMVVVVSVEIKRDRNKWRDISNCIGEQGL
jgi:hypothetical protein